jgi:hypothetical protein
LLFAALLYETSFDTRNACLLTLVEAGADGASGCEAVFSAGGDVAFARLVCYLTIFG